MLLYLLVKLFFMIAVEEIIKENYLRKVVLGQRLFKNKKRRRHNFVVYVSK